jgi:nitrile hydratase
MNGAHDLGGMHGLGPINAEPETSEPVFHAAWERRVFGLALAAGFLGKWNIDKSRYARERQHPIDYLRHTYYENWLVGLERLLLEAGLVTAEELALRRRASSPVTACVPLIGIRSVIRASHAMCGGAVVRSIRTTGRMSFRTAMPWA